MEPHSAEEWRPVPVGGCSHRYEVSSSGRIRSTLTGDILQPAPNSKGYLTVSLYDGRTPKRPRSCTLHRLVCRAFHGEPPGRDSEVDHGDGDKSNNSAGNLEWVTGEENNHRAVRNGQRNPPRGTAHPNAKLTDEQVQRIRDEPAGRGVNARLAREFEVSEGTIRQVRKGTCYRETSHSP